MSQKIIDEIIKSKLKEKITSWNDHFNLTKIEILKKIKDHDLSDIILSFSFKHLKTNHRDFCSVLNDGPCHHVDESKLYCYSCNCTHYNITDSPYLVNDEVFFGKCSVHSKKAKFKNYTGKLVPVKEFQILDCSDCLIPHTHHTNKKEIINDLKAIKNES